jgi:hypothetical protein
MVLIAVCSLIYITEIKKIMDESKEKAGKGELLKASGERKKRARTRVETHPCPDDVKKQRRHVPPHASVSTDRAIFPSPVRLGSRVPAAG